MTSAPARPAGEVDQQAGTGRRDGRVVAAVLVTVVAWASAFLVIRGLRGAFAPGPLALGRLIVGALALGAAVLVRRVWVAPTRREWLLLAACGLLWFGAYTVALNAAEQHVDAGTAAMLVNVGPIVIALLSGALLGEGFPRWLLAGAGVAFAGAVLIGVATSGAGGRDAAGVLLCLLAAVTWSLGVLAQKPALRRLPALQVTWVACTDRRRGVPAVRGRARARPRGRGRPGAARASSTSVSCPRRSPSAPGRTPWRGCRRGGSASPPTWCRRWRCSARGPCSARPRRRSRSPAARWRSRASP